MRQVPSGIPTKLSMIAGNPMFVRGTFKIVDALPNDLTCIFLDNGTFILYVLIDKYTII